jgi:hypothetical protein
MASTWSALKIELLETGQNSGTWGTLTNVNLGDAVLGEAITGSATVDFPTDADVTVTLTDSATSQSARNLRLNITESSTGVGSVRSLILGSGCQIEKFYLINNTGTGAKTVKNTTGTGISVPAGKATLVYNNGTNVVDAASYFTSLTLGSALPVASGGTGLTAGTSGGVLAFTATGTLASSTALAASALVIGGGAGAAPSTTTTGTGVVTALGVNVGTAGAFVVNGGALGSPSSVGTMPAFTLGGTVSGGGNQINNVIIGTTTPLAGAFTSLTASSTATLNTLVSSGATLTGGSINGMTVGATTASSGAFTSLTASTTLGVTGVSTLTAGAVVQGLTVGLGAGAVSTNTAVGVSALAANTTGNNSTAVGYQAGLNNTTGASNVGVGNYSLFANTTGSNNTALGQSALQSNTTASNSVAIGHQALITSTTGASNTAVGHQALNLNTTASNNTAVGYQAGYSNTTGASNAYVGPYAGYYNITGSNNTSLGYGAFSSAGAGGSSSNNTAVGKEALAFNTTASNNTAVGYQAGYNNTTGAANHFIGKSAGFSNLSGSDLIYIGLNTGYYATGLRNTFVGGEAGVGVSGSSTGTNNTAIGYRSYELFTTGTNNVAVGELALKTTSSGSYNVGIGNEALRLNTTASSNTAVGYQAGYTNVIGAYNTFIGYQAGYTSNTGGNGNTCVGTLAGYSLTAGADNTFIGPVSANAGYFITSGSRNSILGGYTGNNDGLDIRTLDNYVVLSDGLGRRQITMAEGQTLALDSAVPNSGTGITFPASQSASSDANTLDDYEEGTFTAGIAFGGAAVGVTYDSTPTCTYTKIGRQVTVTGRVGLSSKGSSTGDATITGLPFTPANTGNAGYGSCSLDMNSVTFANQYAGQITPNSTSINLNENTILGVYSAINDADFSNSSNLLFTATYFV